jgi:hypothetical protein
MFWNGKCPMGAWVSQYDYSPKISISMKEISKREGFRLFTLPPTPYLFVESESISFFPLSLLYRERVERIKKNRVSISGCR